MDVSLPDFIFEKLEEVKGTRDAIPLVETIERYLRHLELKAEVILEEYRDKADQVIVQRKYQIEAELREKKATKAEFAYLEQEIQALRKDFLKDQEKLHDTLMQKTARLRKKLQAYLPQ